MNTKIKVTKTMNTEQDEKILKAFWCMYNTALEKGYSIFYGSQCIKIFSNQKEGSGLIGRIKFQVEKSKEQNGRNILGFKKNKIVSSEYIYLTVINTKNSEHFYGGFNGEKVDKIKNKIIKEIQLNKEKEKEASNKALDELIC